jgi:hypothetical protein
MAEYEFRFMFHGMLRAVHSASVENDALACERARQYLYASPSFDAVVVRCGVRFMRKIYEPAFETAQTEQRVHLH